MNKPVNKKLTAQIHGLISIIHAISIQSETIIRNMVYNTTYVQQKNCFDLNIVVSTVSFFDSPYTVIM
jgi:hypothetical protein